MRLEAVPEMTCQEAGTSDSVQNHTSDRDEDVEVMREESSGKSGELEVHQHSRSLQSG